MEGSNPDRQMSFIGEQIERRLEQAENGVTDLEYRTGVLRRELDNLRALVDTKKAA